MKRFLAFIHSNFIQPFLRSFKRFPETVTLALVMMILAYLQILLDVPVVDQVLIDVLDAAWLVLFYFAGWTLFVERFEWSSKIRIFGDVLFLLGGVTYYFLAPMAATNFIEGSRYTGLLLIGIIFFLVGPYFLKKEGFSLYVLVVETKFFVTGFYSLVLWGGISIILASIENLFRVQIDYKVYSLIMASILGLVTLPVFLGLIPRKEEIFQSQSMNKIWKTVFSNIVLPLVLVFTLILLVYSITSLIPNSPYEPMVFLSSSVVLAFAGIFTLFYLDPIRHEATHLKLYFRAWPYALILVFVGFYVELYRSIGSSGFSVTHVMFLLGGIYPVAVAVVYAVKLRLRLIYTFLMAMDTILLVTLLPYVNAFALTRYALNLELDTLLQSNEMWENGSIVPKQNLSTEEQNKFSSVISRASEIGFDSLQALPDSFTQEDFEGVFGFELNFTWNPIKEPSYYSYTTGSETFGLDTSMFEAVLVFPRLMTSSFEGYYVVYDETNHTLLVTGGELNITINLEDIGDQLRTIESESGYHEVTNEQMEFVFTEEENSVTLVFHTFDFTYQQTNDQYYQYYGDFILAIDAE